MPPARYEQIADAGHFGYLERPDVVDKVLVDSIR